MEYRVIKENDLFLLTDRGGDITGQEYGHGLYTKDTRFLSKLTLKINGLRPVVLASGADQNYISQIVLTNPAVEVSGEAAEAALPRETVELKRVRFIYQGVLYESVTIANYNPAPASFRVSLELDADFKDMFAVRGFITGELGRKTGIEPIGDGLKMSYLGVDHVSRNLRIEWSVPPDNWEKSQDGAVVCYDMELGAGESRTLDFYLTPVIGSEQPARYPHDEAIAELRQSYREWEEQSTAIDSDLPLFNRLVHRGMQDIRILLTDLGCGPFPTAGLPWYAVPFGRDSLIAALQLLPMQPEIAKGTILTMARYQGTKNDPWRDEQPGKIMHELRSGELANSGQIPFTPYYGTIDATPLFVILIEEYVRWTDDIELLREMLPSIARALEWMDACSADEGRGFVAYSQESSKGLVNQGWKDSDNAIVHRDGQLANAPISLVEVQGYVYQAKSKLASLLTTVADQIGDRRELTEWAARLEAEAAALRERFEAAFWMESEQYYALALDREQRQVATITSNPGHLLMTGILPAGRMAAVSSMLVSRQLFNGYGVRTMAEGETAYNPMSYHNGSVWPHDNALCLIGLSQNGFQEATHKIMDGLLAAAEHFENDRLPELFCGYSTDYGMPVSYPVACSPQAWAAATPLVFIQAILGLRLDYAAREVRLRPSLPTGMQEFSVRRMRLGSGYLQVRITRRHGEYNIEIAHNTSGWTVRKESALSDSQAGTPSASSDRESRSENDLIIL
ncbi:glycogen debranching N-terminal domain-containing protein [Cohnella cellulosilytica]|uniref:Glycogen debranching N-terminal domain-containing protein n=1 Tax=Cohnella cellulosilytica TaxID=986710 RepID=A0ABW2FEM8_9BACL